MSTGETAAAPAPAVAAAPEVVIRVRDLVVRFDGADGNPVTVLDGVSLDVRRGETLIVMGGSGCGKSTLLNCLIGEITPQAGSIQYLLPGSAALEIASAGRREMDELRRSIGILFQSGALFSSMTVAENVALPLREQTRLDRAVIDIMTAIKLQQVHMLPHRDKMPAQLSGGQKKRAGLARAIALDPQVLFYDEPSAGLDPVTSCAIDELIMDLAQKLQVTSVVVTHEMDSAFRIADRMVMLHKGRVLRVGGRAEFDRLRQAPDADLPRAEDRLIRQFLNGSNHGPLTDAEGLSDYERLLSAE